MKYENKEMTINELISSFNQNRINLIPPFQRGTVWNLKKRQKLMQNMLSQRPIPAIFFYFADGQSEAGNCSNCGSFHIRCGNCGSVGWYNEEEIEKCSWFCEMRWRLLKEKGMTVGIKELPPLNDESDEEAHEEV